MQFRDLGLLRRTRRMLGVGKVMIVFWTDGGGLVNLVSAIGEDFLIREGVWKTRTGMGVWDR